MNEEQSKRIDYKVLYLEDEEFFYNIVKEHAMMYFPHFSIVNAKDVSGAKQVFNAEHFDAIICDYYLPGENGIEFLKYVRSRCNTVPVIFLTGVDSKDVAIEALNNGANFYFEKQNIFSGEDTNFNNLFYRLENVIRKRLHNCLIYSETDIRKKIGMAYDITIHDIKNCLTIINLSVDSAKLAIGETNDLSKKLDDILYSTENIEDFLSFLGDYQQLENCNFCWQPIGPIIDKLADQFSPKIGIVNDLKENFSIYADRLLEKVFYNIIDNSLSHGKATMLSFRVYLHEGSLVISIVDDGIGISMECKNLIFNKGFGNNTGYGLFFCSEVLSMTNIKIIENGVSGKGARFEMIVPERNYRRLSTI
ncbi:MAG: hybrid sensor histidine kinase/response regulator [Candidatus Pacebacteria bacterium]|nr:hybrid sensor histidine kinase/response regulator [Candidatus Paceibacterota bacterium]